MMDQLKIRFQNVKCFENDSLIFPRAARVRSLKIWQYRWHHTVSWPHAVYIL